MNDTVPVSAAPSLEACRVVELRDYLMQPGGRDLLVDLFERELVETQEAVGMRVIGQFTDLDRPERFVWLRGFADMATRRSGLEAFYGGPAWAAHRAAANATMIDASDVRLLRPSRPTGSRWTPAAPRPRRDAGEDAGGALYTIDLWSLHAPVDEDWRRWFEREALPLLVEHGTAPRAVFETEPAENDWPRLPVRSGEPVFAWLTRHVDAEAAARSSERLAASRRWSGDVLPRLLAAAVEPPRRLRLAPTARSLLR